jgi:uncharacterized protein YjiK
MKTFILIIFLNCLIFQDGCNTGEPDSNVFIPPGLITLQPLKTVDLSSNLVEPSGIIYNSKSNSLLVVSDQRPDIYIIDLNGNILNKIFISGIDMEGIALSQDSDTIYVVEETKRLVSSYLYDGTKTGSMLVTVATNPSNALEGIAIDKNFHLFILNEKQPRMLLKFFNGVEISRIELNYSNDISDICYDEQADCFWIVSDESKIIFKINRDGSLLGEWLIPVTKGEGITVVEDKIYVVCDSDSKMYVFQKP